MINPFYFRSPMVTSSFAGILSLLGLFGCGATGEAGEPTNSVNQPLTLRQGDIDGDARADIALTGGAGWTTVPIAHSLGNGSFSFTNAALANFPSWASGAGVKKLTGDFNGDGKTDLLLTGGGFTTIPVALSLGAAGTFNVVNQPLANFTAWASLPNVKAVVGDFDNDGRDDVALTGNSFFTTIPIAFSNGDGTFTLTNLPLATFEGWSATSGVIPVAGDFNHDGRDDIALVGGLNFSTLPVATATSTRGSFTVSNQPFVTFQGWAQGSGSVPIGGDFNHDGCADIALVGSPSFTTIPIALGSSSGFFSIVNQPLADFTTFATWPNASAVPGDFNNDGRTDIALVGSSSFTTVPIALASTIGGEFSLVNLPMASFPGLAATAGVVPLSGHKAQ